MISDASSNVSIFKINDLIIDNNYAPKKIKSIDNIRLIEFKGKIFAGCGKSIFNPLYKNNYPVINKKFYKQLSNITGNNTSILISIENVNIYANLIVNDTLFCSLEKDLENVTIKAYIVSITSQNRRKFNLIYLKSYQLNHEF